VSSAPGYRDIAPDEARGLVEAGEVVVLDVRTPEEYRALGHIPGSMLLPLDWIACAPATLPPDGKPILVCCEHGVRSARASALLARAGFGDVRNLRGGMAAWAGARQHRDGDPFRPLGPSPWLVRNADLLPRGGEVLDVACGGGRNALLLAAAGFRVRGVDVDGARIDRLASTAARLELPLEAELLDLERDPPDLGKGRFDVVLVFDYLHRPLFPALTAALRPGGVMLYETFTTSQAGRGGPTSPDHLLRPGELAGLVSPLRVVRSREGEHEGRFVAGVAARREP
jgi:rhodanese-related sulfurtransferase